MADNIHVALLPSGSNGGALSFVSKHQDSPHDLTSPSFASGWRAPMVQKQLVRLRNGDAPAILGEVWAAHEGEQVKFVAWDWLSLSELQKLATGLGPTTCAGLCECYSSNYEAWCGGLPDLLLWKDNGKEKDRANSDHMQGGYEVALVEVKGPNDSLSCRQRAWIDNLVRWSRVEGSMHVTVCYVADANC